jgi:putative membrane protein
MSRVFLSSIMVLTLVSASFASNFQDPSQQSQPQAPSQPQVSSGQPGAGQPTANANRQQAPRGNHARVSISDGDRLFVRNASESSMAEVAYAELALQRAESDDVKQFAQQMIDDHKKANLELTRLAMNKGVSMPSNQSTPPSLTGKRREMSDRLATFSGADFDREYMRNQVKMRGETISLFERQVKKGKDSDLRSFAIQSLPSLRERQRTTQDLAMKLGAMKKPRPKAPNNPTPAPGAGPTGTTGAAGATTPPRQ